MFVTLLGGKMFMIETASSANASGEIPYVLAVPWVALDEAPSAPDQPQKGDTAPSARAQDGNCFHEPPLSLLGNGMLMCPDCGQAVQDRTARGEAPCLTRRSPKPGPNGPVSS